MDTTEELPTEPERRCVVALVTGTVIPVAAVLFVLALFGMGSNLLLDRPPGAAVAEPTPLAPGAVLMVDDRFEPHAKIVVVGEAVTWTNAGAIDHTATEDGGLFDSGLVPRGGTFSFTPAEAGLIDYRCTLHPLMVGTLEVTARAPGGGEGEDDRGGKPPNAARGGPYAEITDVQVEGGRYSVVFQTANLLPGQNARFYFSPTDPDVGPFFDTDAPALFDKLRVADTPEAATGLCVVVAGTDFRTVPGSGMCVDVP